MSLSDARRIALAAQILDGDGSLPRGKEGVARAIERLGYVQIDTIHVVRRAHHHALWTRCPDYEPGMLHDLQVIDRRVFEYWAHAMSYLPMSDYRYYVRRMRAGGRKGAREWRAKHTDLIEAVLQRIRAEGPLSSVDFEPPPGTKRGTWWDWKPAKRALEVLFWEGELMIAERRNFQKIYDLTERVLPAHVDAAPPSDEECARFQVRRALGALGIAREREVLEFVKAADKPLVLAALRDLTESGEVVPVEVEEAGKRTGYALADRLDGEVPDGRARILSPFDGLIIQRDRVDWLFGFAYTLECYVPKEKRTYGYFVLPILWGDRLVGRFDPKADRKAGMLIVRTLWLEPWFEADDAFLEQLGTSLVRFALFNGCTAVRIEKTAPAKLRAAASRAVKAAWNATERRPR